MSLADYDFDKFSPNSFALVLPKIPGLGTGRYDEIVLNVHTMNLPSFELGVQNVPWQGSVTHIPDGVTTWGNLTVSFMVDEKLTNWRMFLKWMKNIDNNKDVYFPQKREDYSIDFSVLMLDNYKKPSIGFKFSNAFPISLSELRLSYREGEKYQEAEVTFSYDYYEEQEIH